MENEAQFIAENAQKQHDLCEVMFDNLARIKNAGIKSRLEQPVVEINRVLLRIESNKLKNVSLNRDVEELLARLHDLVREIDSLAELPEQDVGSIKLIRSYGSDIIQNYAVKMLNLE